MAGLATKYLAESSLWLGVAAGGVRATCWPPKIGCPPPGPGGDGLPTKAAHSDGQTPLCDRAVGAAPQHHLGPVILHCDTDMPASQRWLAASRPGAALALTH